MGLPVVARSPANLTITAATTQDRIETVTSGETAFVIVAVASGGAGAQVTGGGTAVTWTQIRNDSDGTRRAIIFRGTGLDAGSQTVTLSFTNTTSCSWSWVAVTGISTVDPDDASDTKTTASSTRTATDTVTSLTTSNNVMVVGVITFSANTNATTVPTGFTRITPSSSARALFYAALSTGLSASALTVTHNSASNAAIGAGASFNGDDPATGGPFPHYARRKMTGGMLLTRGGM